MSSWIRSRAPERPPAKLHVRLSLTALTSALILWTAAATPEARAAPASQGVLTVRVFTPELPSAHAAAVQQAVASHLGDLVDWPLQPAPDGGPCTDAECLYALAQGAYALEVVALVPDRALEVRAAFVDARTGQTVR